MTNPPFGVVWKKVEGPIKDEHKIKGFNGRFCDSQAAKLRTISPYLPSREASAAAIGNSVSIAYLDYDWGLNSPPLLLNEECDEKCYWVVGNVLGLAALRTACWS